MIKSKQCVKCEQLKSFEQFNLCTEQPDGLQSQCKDCQNIERQARDAVNSEEGKKKAMATTPKPQVFEGKQYPSIVALCEAHGVSYVTYWSRIDKGYTQREALGIDKKEIINGNAKSYVVNGKHYSSQTSLCDAHDTPVITFQNRLKRGWSVEEALNLKKTDKGREKQQCFEGKEYDSTKDLCDAHGVPTRTYHGRLEKGWTQREALGLDKRDNLPANAEAVEFEGKTYPSKRHLYDEHGIAESTYLSRINAGWTQREALNLDKRVRPSSAGIDEKEFDAQVEALRGKLTPKHFYGLKHQATPEQWAAQLDYNLEYRKENKEKQRKYAVDWITEKRKNDPLRRFIDYVRNTTRRAFSKKHCPKNSKSARLIGCTWDVLESQFKSLFTKGMSFDNLGEWEIDHIIPIALASNENHVKVLCHHHNLQPLWKDDNAKKADNIIPSMVEKALEKLIPTFGKPVLREILANASQDKLVK